MQKEIFSKQRISKLDPKGNELFQVLESVNNNAYKVDLLYEYRVSATFNVFYLSLFDLGDDLRMNLFKERGDDVNLDTHGVRFLESREKHACENGDSRTHKLTREDQAREDVYAQR